MPYAKPPVGRLRFEVPYALVRGVFSISIFRNAVLPSARTALLWIKRISMVGELPDIDIEVLASRSLYRLGKIKKIRYYGLTYLRSKRLISL